MATNNTIDFQWSTTPTKDTPPLREQPQPLNGTPKELEDIFVVPQEDAADFGEELTSFFKGQEPAKSTQATTTIPLPRTPAPIQPLTLRINDKKTLYAMWIPIFKTGGLFIPKDQLSGKTFRPGDSLMFRLSLPDDPARAVLLGVKMAWETPNYSEHRMTAGIGFAFDACDTAEEIKQRAERLLTDMPLNTPNFTI